MNNLVTFLEKRVHRHLVALKESRGFL